MRKQTALSRKTATTHGVYMRSPAARAISAARRGLPFGGTVTDKTTQSEMDSGSMRRVAPATNGAARTRVLGANLRSLAAVAVLAAAAGACGSDSNSDPEAVPTETPTPPATSMNPATTPAPAPAEEPPAPSGSMPAAGEAPMGSVPLDNPPAPAAMEGNSGAEGDMPAPDDGAAEPPPAAEEEPPAEPVPPAAFNPCPTDGTPCRIMPLGDSITFGFVPNSGGQSNGGYRVELFRQAVLDGHDITFVGTNPRGANGPNEVEGQPFPRNNEGISGDTIPGVAGRVDAALAANPPDIVLLHIGTNHLYGGLPADIPGQLADLLDQITDDAPDALVVVAQITPLTGANNGVEEYNATIPAMVQERVGAGKHLLLLDIFSPFSASGSLAERLPDNIHPDVEGYAVMGRTWYDAIESFLP
jgi:lysophospholipase L1-like esterase